MHTFTSKAILLKHSVYKNLYFFMMNVTVINDYQYDAFINENLRFLNVYSIFKTIFIFKWLNIFDIERHFVYFFDTDYRGLI